MKKKHGKFNFGKKSEGIMEKEGGEGASMQRKSMKGKRGKKKHARR